MKKQFNRKHSSKLWVSQNFLKNSQFVASLIDKTSLTKNDLVVEIGPGKGIITKELSKICNKVIAVEKDKKLYEKLSRDLTNFRNISLIKDDFLKWDFPKNDFKIFANIPFNFTAQIIEKITNLSHSPTHSFLVVEDKAACRFMGKPKESQVSILLKPFFNFKILTYINRNEFQPVPNVNVVLLEIFKKKHSSLKTKDFNQFKKFITYGFNQWQPSVDIAFVQIFSKKQLNRLDKDFKLKGLKPSQLKLVQWLGMFKNFQNFVDNDKKSLVEKFVKDWEKKQEKVVKLRRSR